MGRRSFRSWLAAKAARLGTVALVSGRSMEPTLRSGDLAFFVPPRTLRPGDIVLATAPTFGLIVKRLVQIIPEPGIDDDGSMQCARTSHAMLLGDNPRQSTDSRHWGPVAVTSIVGVARLIVRIPRIRDLDRLVASGRVTVRDGHIEWRRHRVAHRKDIDGPPATLVDGAYGQPTMLLRQGDLPDRGRKGGRSQTVGGHETELGWSRTSTDNQ
jgi:hypothetical protein